MNKFYSKVYSLEYLKMMFCITLILPFGCYAQVPDSNYQLLYEENFNADTLNTDDWYYRDQTVMYHGGYNKKENVSVETQDGIGYLRIDYNMRDVDGDSIDDIVGGGVMSSNAFGYGYYEARIKFYDQSKGFHQSFWTIGLSATSWYTPKFLYTEDAKNDLVPWSNGLLEIDGIELDSDHNSGGVNFHWHKPSHNVPSGAHKRLSSNYMETDQWINIGFEWKPGLIIYYIDGVERHRLAYNDSRYAAQQVLLTGLANNTSFFGGGGIPLPGACMKVDFFRYYTKPTLANLAGNSGFETNNGNSEAPLNWIQDDGVYKNISRDGAKVVFDSTASNGQGYFKYDCKPNVTMILKHRLDYIPNGTYQLKAKLQRTTGLDTARMGIISNGSEISVDIPTTDSWTEISIDSIEISSNEAVIAFTMKGETGDWVKVDEVEFIISEEDVEPLVDQFENIIIDNGDTGYSESGTWTTSGLTGYDGSSTRYSSKTIGDYAQWAPNIPEAGDYHVYIYKVVHESSDPSAKIEVAYNGGTDTLYLDYTTGTSGWTYLGKYNFAAGTTGFVRHSLNTPNKHGRADAAMFQKAELIIDNGDAGYAESGTWTTSSLTGYNGSSTRYSSKMIGDDAKWNPNFPETGDYNVYLYKVVHENSDPSAKIEVAYNGGTDTLYLDYSTGTSGWVYLGKYNFAEGTNGYVQNSLNTAGKYGRADAVKFVVDVDTGGAASRMAGIEKSLAKSVAFELFSETGFELFPNPTNSVLNIKLPGYHQANVDISIFDLQGKLMWKKSMKELLEHETLAIDMGSYQKGLYILRFTNGSEVISKKIIKY